MIGLDAAECGARAARRDAHRPPTAGNKYSVNFAQIVARSSTQNGHNSLKDTPRNKQLIFRGVCERVRDVGAV